MQEQLQIKPTKDILLIYQDNQIYFLNSSGQFSIIYNHEELLYSINFLKQLHLEEIEKKIYLDYDAIPFHKEVNISTKMEPECWLDCSIEKIQFNDKPAILIGAKDITKYKQLEQTQEKIIAEKKFVSMICHELKNSLNIIALSSNLLDRYDDRWKSATRKKYLNNIKTRVENLNLLIDEWLILDKAQLGKLNIRMETLDIEIFSRNLLSDINPNSSSEIENAEDIITQQKINFVCSGDSSLVFIDRRILQIVLNNLLENALKYSPQGSEIDFIIECSSDILCFKIIDRGIGIDPKDLKQLFEPFFRGANTNNIDGNGLGLTIVKKLVTLLHGNISVESEIGLGTEFKITFPKFKDT